MQVMYFLTMTVYGLLTIYNVKVKHLQRKQFSHPISAPPPTQDQLPKKRICPHSLEQTLSPYRRPTWKGYASRGSKKEIIKAAYLCKSGEKYEGAPQLVAPVVGGEKSVKKISLSAPTGDRSHNLKIIKRAHNH